MYRMMQGWAILLMCETASCFWGRSFEDLPLPARVYVRLFFVSIRDCWERECKKAFDEELYSCTIGWKYGPVKMRCP
eukprot:6344460-Amphidinium_carterae.1